MVWLRVWESSIVGLPGLPHLPEDFEPALTQAAERAGVALPFGAVRLVMGLRPGAGFAAVIGPLMGGAAQSEVLWRAGVGVLPS